MRPPILTDPDDSELLRRLVTNLPLIAARLDDPSAWTGIRVSEGGTDYWRVQARSALVTPGSPRHVYTAAVHYFPSGSHRQMHQHRRPIAVMPVGEDCADDDPLYDMPWLDGRIRGEMAVRSRRPYAIERCDVAHAVHGIAAHMSINIADITDEPVRPTTNTITPTDDGSTAAILARISGIWQVRTR